MRQETIYYAIDQQNFIGQLVYPDNDQALYPVILVAPAWKGQDAFVKQKAKELTELGYASFIIDMYGNGKEAQTDEEAAALMEPLFEDRALLQKRVKAAYEKIKQNPVIDSSNIGAIGFCFGGLVVIELLRSGADVKGVVSFHAVLGNKKGSMEAKTVPISSPIKGALLMLHGYEDPLVPESDVLATQKEMNEAGVDWQMHIYGHTAHAFTNPQEHNQEKGLVFNARSSKRAWKSMSQFFDTLLIS